MNKNVLKWITFVSLLAILASACYFYNRFHKPIYNDWFFSISESGDKIAVMRMVSRTGSRDYHYEVWTYRPNGSGKKRICRIPDSFEPDYAAPKQLFWLDDHIMVIARNQDGLRTLIRIIPETGQLSQWSHGPVDEKIIAVNKYGALTSRQLEYYFHYLLFRKFEEKDYRIFGKIRSGNLLTKAALTPDSYTATAVESYTEPGSPTEINSILNFTRTEHDSTEPKPEGIAINDVLISFPDYPADEKQLTFMANNGFYLLNTKQDKDALRLFKLPEEFRLYYGYDEVKNAAYIPAVKDGIIYRLDIKNNRIHTINTGVKIMTPIEPSGDGSSLYFMTSDKNDNFRVCRFNMTENKIKYMTSEDNFEGRHQNNDKIKRAAEERINGLKSFGEMKPQNDGWKTPGEDSPSNIQEKIKGI